MDLRDRVAVITGASSGVGRALALELARRGLRVLARAQLALGVAAVGLVARTLAKQVNHDDARVRLAAKAARWYVKRGRRELVMEKA